MEKTVLVIVGMKTLIKAPRTWDGTTEPIRTFKTVWIVTLKSALGIAWLSHGDRRTCPWSPFVVILLVLEVIKFHGHCWL